VTTAEKTPVLVLGGGPDRERDISLASARAVARALRDHGGFEVHEQTIDRPAPAELASMPPGVVFPVLHGSWGEGGPLQDLLAESGRPYVGCRPFAARCAMDKIAAKLAAARRGAPTQPAALVAVSDPVCPLPLPVVVKPAHEGSSVGLHVCTDHAAWRRAHEEAARQLDRPYLVESLIGRQGARRELAVGMLSGRALPIIEVTPAEGVYDFEAKYVRGDTRYTVRPELPNGLAERLGEWAEGIAESIGASGLSRVDFMLDADGAPWFLEINTMPGFTASSLYPMAARAAGIEMPELCARLVAQARPGGDAA